MCRFHSLAFLLLICLQSALTEPFFLHMPSDIEWVTATSPHFKILFDPVDEPLAKRALSAAEKAYQLLDPIFEDKPELTWIVLATYQDSPNGFGISFPYPHMVIFAAPPQPDSQLAALDDWLSSVILHEYAHVLHLFPAHGLWSGLRSIFGNWISPNGLLPSHMHEGLATFLETEFTQGGRGRGNQFKMFRRKAVEANAWGESFVPLDLLDPTISRWPQGASAYFFGYQIYQELWKRKGAKGIRQWVNRSASNWPYLISRPLNEVYGQNATDLWKDTFISGASESRTELATAAKESLSELEPITENYFQKWDLTLSPDKTKLLYRAYSPKEGFHWKLWNLEKKVFEDSFPLPTTEGNGTCWIKSPNGELIYSVRSESKRGKLTKLLSGLNVLDSMSFDVKEDDKPIDHIQHLSCHQPTGEILIYQEKGGNGTLKRLKPVGDQSFKTLQKWNVPEGTWITGVSADDHSAWFFLREGVRSHLYLWESNQNPKLVSTLDALVYRLIPQANHSFDAIAEIDGRAEIWNFLPKKFQIIKKVAVNGGMISFDTLGDSSVMVSNYEHGGYGIAKTKTQNLKSVELTRTPPPLMKLSETGDLKTEPYSALSTLRPQQWFPFILSVPGGWELAALVLGFDIAQRHNYGIRGGYDTRGLVFGDVNYQYRFGESSSLGAQTFFSPSYIQSQAAFLKRWGGELNYGFSTGILPIRFRLLYRKAEASFFGPEKHSVGLGIDTSLQFLFKQRPLAIAPERGIKLSLSHEQYFDTLGSTDSYFSSVASLDQYWAAPWYNDHVFYFSSRFGYTEGAASYVSFFESGGELLISQGRNFFLNRGFLPGIFFARRIFNQNFEYRFPLARIERGLGLLPLKLNQIHAALVADLTSFDSGPAYPKVFHRYFGSFGAEIKTDWTFSYYVPSRLRAGIYHGVGDFGENLYVTIAFESLL